MEILFQNDLYFTGIWTNQVKVAHTKYAVAETHIPVYS